MNLLTSLLALGGWGLWAYTVLFVSPEARLAPIAFYSGLFVGLTCTLARLLSGSGGRAGRSAEPSVPSLGHAAVVSTLLLFAVWLQSLRMLTSLNGTLLASMFVFIELGFFLTGNQRRPRARRHPAQIPASETKAMGEG